MMDDEERRESILSLQFLCVGTAIIYYIYRFSYLYIPLYQFCAFSTEFMFKIKPTHMILCLGNNVKNYNV